jgi:hypothetical protein
LLLCCRISCRFSPIKYDSPKIMSLVEHFHSHYTMHIALAKLSVDNPQSWLLWKAVCVVMNDWSTGFVLLFLFPIYSLHCVAYLYCIIQEALCSYCHSESKTIALIKEGIISLCDELQCYELTKHKYCTKTDITYWSRTVHQSGQRHSETCFVSYFY